MNNYNTLYRKIKVFISTPIVFPLRFSAFFEQHSVREKEGHEKPSMNRIKKLEAKNQKLRDQVGKGADMLGHNNSPYEMSTYYGLIRHRKALEEKCYDPELSLAEYEWCRNKIDEIDEKTTMPFYWR